MQLPKAAFLLINMNRSTKRLEQCAAKLNQQGICYQRIPAVDGRQLNAKQLTAVTAPALSKYHKVLSKSEIGCYLSHRKCWLHVVEHNLDYAVILEDDFIVAGGLGDLHLYINAINKSNIGWDCIKLMEYQHKRKAVISWPCLDKQLVRYNKIPSCALAYVISKQGAIKMLKQSEKIARPVDIDFQHWWESNILVYGLKPYMFAVDDDEESTIDQDRLHDKIEKSMLRKYIQKLYFYRNNKKHLAELKQKSK